LSVSSISHSPPGVSITDKCTLFVPFGKNIFNVLFYNGYLDFISEMFSYIFIWSMVTKAKTPA